MSSPAGEPTPVSVRWQQLSVRPVYVALRRALVLGNIVVALYVIIGTLTDRIWWYGLFWDDRDRVSYAKEGLRWLIDEAFWLALGIVTALIIVIVVGRIQKRRLFKVIDSAPWVILMCVWLAVAVDALVLRHTQADDYLSPQPLALAELLQNFRKRSSPPELVTPVYFHWVDGDRVESLYNQLEPELKVSEREITGKDTLKGTATAGVGETKIGVEMGSENGAKSTYTPAKLLADRKCVEVMRYVLETWPENYFDSATEWQIRMIYRDAVKADEQARARIDYSALKALQPLDGKEEQQPKTPTGSQKQLFSELKSLRGYIFIEGDFDQTVAGNHVILVQRFMDHPLKCRFRALLPTSAARSLPMTNPLHLTVFGDVTRPLRDDGFVDVVSIAVY